MNQESILTHFRETDALLEGHFELSSGLHSPKYLQCAKALQYPADAANYGRAIGEALISHLSDSGISPETVTTVAAPAIGGLVIGYEVASALNLRFIWTERKSGEMLLRRGFDVPRNEKIIVVEDVITTGGSVRECVSVLESLGAECVAGVSIIDRSNGVADIGVPRIALVNLDVPSYKKEDCPLCASGIAVDKPGSRG
ncbi:MAG: orotate phosphoribosyltransferase [Pyrinomonadaceae bacterium]